MAANLDSHFVLAPSLEMYFVNKDTGLPLTNGKVYFFEDQAPTVPKPVYEIVSAAPGGPYSYVALPNPVTLSAVGTFQDNNNNDILPYYFPYSGTPSNPGSIELYYIEVYDSQGVLQFTREAWPNLTATDITADQDVTNFVPNGQFLLHNNVPASSANSFTANQISQASTIIGQGGWSFDRPIGSTATDFVSFIRYPTTESPTGNPRFAVEIETTVTGGDAYKDLRLKFPSVNQFASTTQPYNLYFEAEALNGSDIPNCQIIVRKFYGTGGSATTEDVKATFTLVNNNIQKYNFSFTFGENTGKSIGALDDDYMQIVMRLPGNSVQTAAFTDFCITVNDEPVTTFPTQTNAEQLAPSTAGWLPTPDHNGQDLYLPIILTAAGCTFDHSQIGIIEQNVDQVTTSIHPTTNLLRCDGGQYLTADYSPLGIPYSRLQQFLFNNGHATTLNVPIFGTGNNYSTAYISGGLNTQLMIATNKAGSQTTAADGGTGFTFGPQILAGAATREFTAGANSANIINARNTQSTLAMAFDTNANTSGFSVTDQNSPSLAGYFFGFTVLTVAAAALDVGAPATPALYWSFGNSATHYYVWYHVGANGADPAPFGTGIRVNLTATMTAEDVAIATTAAIGAQQVDMVTVTGVPPASSYFNFYANSLKYTAWYKVDGSGTQPVVASTDKYIEIDVLSGDTAAQVASKTQVAINSLYFAVPDLRGVFLRGIDSLVNPMWDIDVTSRYGNAYTIAANNVGTFELDQYTKHNHAITTTQAAASNATSGSGGGAAVGSVNTGTSGQSETRPVNMFVNFSIRY